MGGFTVPDPHAGQTRTFFDSYSQSYDLVFGLLPYRKLLWDAFVALDLEPGMRLLDAGCGTGNFEHFISQKRELPPISIDALDFSAGMLAKAAEKCADLDYAQFVQGDLGARLPYESDTFDRIVSINVLYAVPDWRATLDELIRVLKPGGRLVVTSTRVGWSYSPILADHFRRVRNIWGPSRRVAALAKPLRWFTPRGVGSFTSNVLVQDRLERQGLFPSFSEDELHDHFAPLATSGLVSRYEVSRVFCDQNLMASAEKADSDRLASDA